MEKRICKQCGREFTITDSEVEFYNSKNLDLPKRCSSCRKKNKNNSSNKSNDEKTTYENNNEVKVNNIDNNNDKNKNNKGKLVKSAIALVLVFALLFIGKVFNLPLDGIFDLSNISQSDQSESYYSFRNDQFLTEHFEKHKSEFDYTSEEEYLEGANEVINSKDSMHKKEDEDGDEIYYDADKNEIVFLSEDGYIRTYFRPSDGINYFNRQ